MVTDMLAEERADYRATYRDHADHFLAVSPIYGRFLYMMARAGKATRIVEFGTSMGISTIYLAAALRDNGGGHLIGSELEPAKVKRGARPSRRGRPGGPGGCPRRRCARDAQGRRRRH